MSKYVEEAGTYRAKAAMYQLGRASTGNEYISIAFDIEGGKSIVCTRYMTDAALEYTIKDLHVLGWDGNEKELIAEKSVLPNIVELVIEMKEYKGDNPKHQGKSFPEVRWINPIGGAFFGSQIKLEPAARHDLGGKIKARYLAIGYKPPVAPVGRQPGTAKDDKDIPF